MKPSNPKFCHPYEPYDIQLGFMSNLYDCIENGKVGIFESPTGTGKSLSLICGCLTWLRDHKRRSIDELSQTTMNDPNDWLGQAERAARKRELILEREELEKKLATIRKEDEKRRRLQIDTRTSKKPRQTDPNAGSTSKDEEQFVLQDYESDEDRQATNINDQHGLSSTTQALLDKLKGSNLKSDDPPEIDETKIIFCSRTHSQLTQFIHELRRVAPPSSMSLEKNHEETSSEIIEETKHLPLGSRKNLCINDKVSCLPSTTAINERCLELQKPNTKKEDKCKFLPSKDNEDILSSFRDRSIAQIRDIEDAANLGRELGICPYYASRAAIGPSEVLTLPYPMLLQKSAREALGVPIKDNVIVIDEAHNLMDAIADTFSISMRLSQFQYVVSQVTAYVQHFKNRLKGKNRVYITQIIRLLNSIINHLSSLTTIPDQEIITTAGELMSGKGVDQIKPHKLLQYLHDSKLAYKIEGYSDLKETEHNQVRPKGILMQFQSFVVALMNPAAEGRFFAGRHEKDVIVRYTLLDPREHFRDIVQNARAVILAGGTMSPVSDYVNYLFSYLKPDQLQTFTFGHIVPKENILAKVVEQSPSGQVFDFTFDKRRNEIMILELGNLLIRVCHNVPDGVVVFFPSYDYLSQVISVWRKSTGSKPIMEQLAIIKSVFEEQKGILVDDLLREYAQAIDSNKGGLMLSVVGGKLSEGINFSDRLGRAVVAVGLPFPNAHGAEWKSKIEHVETLRYIQCKEEENMTEADAKKHSKLAGREIYENACMRAVNQSIGRAIRHRNDYAVILLVDRRFATGRIQEKLPGWIRGSMAINGQPNAWQTIESEVRAFFIEKQ